MIFEIERKYIILIAILLVGLLAGGFVLFRQNAAAGSGAAQISRVFDNGGKWVEIKPRVANSTSTLEGKVESKASETAKPAKEEKPVISWCVQKNSDRFEKKIIINEVAWMGTVQSYSDEWIELKNITSSDIDLSGWQLQNKSQKIKISFGPGEILPAAGFYLLERTNDDSVPGIAANKTYSGSLGNSKEALYLFDKSCVVEDLVLAENKWPAGDNTAKKTMVRKADLTWATGKIPGGTPAAENY